MSTAEKLMHHWDSLKNKHDKLDKQIKESYNHYDKDELVHKLKVEKLHIKEEMSNIEKQLGIKK